MTHDSKDESVFEVRIRAMLEHRAQDIAPDVELEATNLGVAPMPTDEQHHGPGRRPLHALLVAACVVAALGGLAIALNKITDSSGSTTADRPAQDPSADGLPVGVLESGLFVFDGDRDAIATADAYLADRLPDLETVVIADLTTIEADRGVARWRWVKDGALDEFDIEGWIHLRRVDGRWNVVAAITDGIDTEDVVIDGDGGTIRATSGRGQNLAIDITDLDTGNPIDHRTGEIEPDRDGRRPAGTLAEAEGAAPTIALTATLDPPAVNQFGVRLQEVGGTFLSITEFALSLPATVASTEDPPQTSPTPPPIPEGSLPQTGR